MKKIHLSFGMLTLQVVFGLVLGGCAQQRIVSTPSPVGGPTVVERQPGTAVSPGLEGGRDKESMEKRLEFGEEEKLTDMEFVTGPSELEGAARAERTSILPNVSFVDMRMKIYADKISGWESLAKQIEDHGLAKQMPPRWDECLASIEEMFRGYSGLMEVLLVQEHPAVKEEKSVVDPWLIFQKDINLQEGGCDPVYVDAASLISNRDSGLSDKEVQKGGGLVVQYADEGRYDEAIKAFDDLVGSEPARAVGTETSKMYGLALLRTGRFEMATEVLAKTLENMRPSGEERELRRLVADLLLASGKISQARSHYRKLADYYGSRMGDEKWVADQLALIGELDATSKEFPLYLEVLKYNLSFDGRNIPEGMGPLVRRMEEEFRGSLLSDKARQMLTQLEDSIKERVAGQLERVDVLTANRDYDQAKSVLEKLMADDLPSPVHDTVQRSMDNLLQTETKQRRERRALLEKSLSEQWDEAVLLLDSKKYDEAIEVFKGLLNTEYDVPARANIQKAAEAASVEMRRRSAAIFVKARKEEDYARKREFLRESWQLLYDITVKYPDVRVIDKVRQNLGIIEKNIEDFDPVMFEELRNDRKFESEGRIQLKPQDWLS